MVVDYFVTKDVLLRFDRSGPVAWTSAGGGGKGGSGFWMGAINLTNCNIQLRQD